jgi:hypothetical protein
MVANVGGKFNFFCSVTRFPYFLAPSSVDQPDDNGLS